MQLGLPCLQTWGSWSLKALRAASEACAVGCILQCFAERDPLRVLAAVLVCRLPPLQAMGLLVQPSPLWDAWLQGVLIW